VQTHSIWESRSQLVQATMAIHSRTSNLEKGSLPYMAPDELILIISLNPSMFHVYSLYSMTIFVAISCQGLSFFPTQNFYCEKQNTGPKRKPMHDTLALEWFSFSRNDSSVFLIEKHASGRDAELIFIAI